MLGTSRQISRATMSAPALAMATACARPWPRAAPLMTATCRRDVRTKDLPPLRLLINVIRLTCRPVHQPRAGSGDWASGCGPLTNPTDLVQSSTRSYSGVRLHHNRSGRRGRAMSLSCPRVSTGRLEVSAELVAISCLVGSSSMSLGPTGSSSCRVRVAPREHCRPAAPADALGDSPS